MPQILEVAITTTMSSTHQSEIAEENEETHGQQRIHPLTLIKSIQKNKPHYLKVSDPVFKRLLLDAVSDARQIVQSALDCREGLMK